MNIENIEISKEGMVEKIMPLLNIDEPVRFKTKLIDASLIRTPDNNIRIMYNNPDKLGFYDKLEELETCELLFIYNLLLCKELTEAV